MRQVLRLVHRAQRTKSVIHGEHPQTLSVRLIIVLNTSSCFVIPDSQSSEDLRIFALRSVPPIAGV